MNLSITPPTIDNCKLCSLNGYAHIALTALGWDVLLIDGEHVLLRAPFGWVELEAQA